MFLQTSKDLANTVGALRKDNFKIAVCNGTFDILHMDHIELFKQASEKADRLIVLINSDASVKENKGPKRPILDETNRSRLVDAIKYVSYVYIFDGPTPIPTLDIIKPDIYVSGLDYGKDCIEKETVEKNGGIVIPKIGTKSISTTSIIERVLDAYGDK